MNDAVKKISPEIIKWASSLEFKVRVYLFGSQVTNSATPESDIDIAVEFLDNPTKQGRTMRWFDFHTIWQEDLSNCLSGDVHLVLYEDDDSPALKKYLENDFTFVVYESEK